MICAREPQNKEGGKNLMHCTVSEFYGKLRSAEWLWRTVHEFPQNDPRCVMFYIRCTRSTVHIHARATLCMHVFYTSVVRACRIYAPSARVREHIHALCV